MNSRALHPRQWNVRTRSAVAAALVVTLGLVVASAAMSFVLFHSLARSAQGAADARAQQIVEQLRSDPPAGLDRALLATDGQVGVIQVLDGRGAVVAASAGAPTTPLTQRTVPPTEAVSLGRVQDAAEGDYWVTAHGAATMVGPATVVVGADREPVESVVTTVASMLAMGGPVIVILVALATYGLVGGALGPVEWIRSRVSEISTEHLSERVPVPPTGDEIARLAETMNDMLARLESGHLAQRAFISDASHELRSPLSTIRAALELAHTRPDMIDTALIDDSLLPEARRMSELLDNLLLLVRADEHQLSGRAEDVDIDDILQAENIRLRSMSDLQVRASITPVRVTGDATQLTRVVRNLVDNAARHARSTVQLDCHRQGYEAVIVVADDGPGVPRAERDHVFERFVRLDAARARDTGGSGLGLAIVAEIVAAHHGTVQITDRDGGGARFAVTLPADVDSYISADTNL